MGDDIKGIWHRFQSGLEVTVAVRGHSPEKSLGVRDGFLRYLHDVLEKDPPLTVRLLQLEGRPELPMTDSETLDAARDLVGIARQQEPGTLFIVACEEGLSEISAGRTSADRTSAGRTSAGHSDIRHVVQSWAVIDMLGSDEDAAPIYEQAWGSSGGVQIPDSVLHAAGRPGHPLVFPSTRRGRGMVQAITGNAENRRTTSSQAVFLALCSLLYPRFSS